MADLPNITHSFILVCGVLASFLRCLVPLPLLRLVQERYKQTPNSSPCFIREVVALFQLLSQPHNLRVLQSSVQNGVQEDPVEISDEQEE